MGEKPGEMKQGIVLEAVVDVLVRDLYQHLKTQGRYALQFQSQFEEMKTQLNLMRSFLTDADRLKKKHETIKTTFFQLRELTYEADDLVIDCLIRADYRKRKGSSSCYSFSPRELFFRYQTGKKLTHINNRIVKMRKNLSYYVTPIVGQPSSEDSSRSVGRWTSQDLDQSEIVGLTDDVRRIEGWILPQTEVLHRIAIVGMGGLGKTTITKKIFNDIHVRARFERKIWVSVSQTFSEIEIMKSMLRQLKEDYSGSDTGELLHRIRQVLLHKTYLIIMDDVWSIDNGWWDRISTGLPKIVGHSSCIIITSRNEDVVRRMGVVEARIHRPRFLDEEESWSLFCKVAFMATNGICRCPQLEEIGKKIVGKCGGLPLAIKTTGGLLSSKTRSYGEWKRIYDNFHEKLATEGSSSENSVIASLQLSYDELPTYLKHCMLCFSIFPEDHEINAEQLIYWWVGEGFVHEKRSETATESALSYLSELISRCLVEVVQRRNYDGRVYKCKMHDMVRDLTIRIASEEEFCIFDEGGRHIPTVDSRRLGVTTEMDFHTFAWNSKLRALLLMKGHSICFNRNIGLAKVKSLRVLDLSYVKLDTMISTEDLWKWITSLKRLACLNLRNAVGLVELPYYIEKLWGLQILILAECERLAKLPASITTLEKLRVLNVANCPSLQYLPQGLSRLSNLEELHGFKLGGQTNAGHCHLRELKDLTRLHILQIHIHEESSIEEDELIVLAQLQQLRVFRINADNCEDIDVLQKLNMLSPPPQLEELHLGHYRGETTPEWINPTLLPQLQYLSIEDSQLNHMSPCFWGSDGTTWKVEGLCLKLLPRLQEEWAVVQRAMPLLRYLEVSHCYMLQSFPCNVVNLGFWKKAEEENEDGSSEELVCQEEHNAAP